MRQKIIGLTNAIRKVLENHNDAISWKDICYKIQERTLVEIAPAQEEITYVQPNWHHSVRRILSELVSNGEVLRVSKAMYKKV
jgi:hypothetical protein